MWRNNASLGKSALSSEMIIASNALQVSGDYELRFGSNALDDLWVVVDWGVDVT